MGADEPRPLGLEDATHGQTWCFGEALSTTQVFYVLKEKTPSIDIDELTHAEDEVRHSMADR